LGDLGREGFDEETRASCKGSGIAGKRGVANLPREEKRRRPGT